MNPATKRSLGVQEARSGAFIFAAWYEQQWKLTKSGEKEDHYNIVYPEQVDGEDLSIGVSSARVYPPLVALHGSPRRTIHWELDRFGPPESRGSEREIPRFRSQLRW
ncbi:hypothetical protein BX616_005485 [Lobosporangium transversale]|nr:hypothetical protein BX616_005485 [Lobosporangium transversale]